MFSRRRFLSFLGLAPFYAPAAVASLSAMRSGHREVPAILPYGEAVIPRGVTPAMWEGRPYIEVKLQVPHYRVGADGEPKLIGVFRFSAAATAEVERYRRLFGDDRASELVDQLLPSQPYRDEPAKSIR